MTKAPVRGRMVAPELPVDAVDAAAGFGLLAGSLSIVLGFFTGLLVALAAITFSLGLLRAADGRFRATSRLHRGAGFGVAAAGWALFLTPGLVPTELRGAVLGGSLVPLWILARGRRAFGGH